MVGRKLVRNPTTRCLGSPYLKATYPENNYVWTQESKPSYTSTKCQKFCTDNKADFWSNDI
uniref:Uncharacterized protein n=1 Tax=Lepeophtheirus salmonis TaxID=72036 RepID=A0A0K2SVG6_LEPSM